MADDSDLAEVYNTERHFLYVACARAGDHLLVTSVSKGAAGRQPRRFPATAVPALWRREGLFGNGGYAREAERLLEAAGEQGGRGGIGRGSGDLTGPGAHHVRLGRQKGAGDAFREQILRELELTEVVNAGVRASGVTEPAVQIADAHTDIFLGRLGKGLAVVRRQRFLHEFAP